MIEKCLIIIAFSELVRVIFLAFDVARIRHDSRAKDNLYAEFIKSIRSSDKEFVKELLKQFEEELTMSECTRKTTCYDCETIKPATSTARKNQTARSTGAIRTVRSASL